MNTTIKHIIFNLAYFTLGICSLFFIENWYILVACWLLIAFGNGTAGHRYFSHSQFNAGPKLHWFLAVWCTISGYSSTIYWKVQHIHHHRNTDTVKDIHSPVNGFIKAFFLWIFDRKRIESVFDDRASKIILVKALHDRAIKFTSNYFITINITFLIFLYIVNEQLLYGYAIGFLIEHIRLGIVNTLLHIPMFPGNYRNHETKDKSQNNFIIGILSLGFGWHNNHHHNPSKLILTERWWELDLEGYLGKLLNQKEKV
jgi:stearoyl-CoA desaturase (delta-9 desaturase)